MSSNNNKKIARNTIFLYCRMLFLTAISLYTVRITLKILGVVDYGIYNVVGSLVGSLSFLTGTLTSATQRFLSFHLGRRDFGAYNKTFNILLLCFICMSIVIILIAEGLGPLILNNWLHIPPDRITATKFVYQTVIITFIFHFLTIPFTSAIVANEKMNAFALISIGDGILKLLIVFLLTLINIDRLTLYGCLMSVQALSLFTCYVIYCNKTFRYCKMRLMWDATTFRELFSYTGWNLFGSITGMLTTQGQNILLNIYFGPVVNAAKAIGDKITNTIQSFSSNFYMAVSPQIVKSYAAGENDRMINLGIRSSKLSFYLLYILSFPLICCMRPILNLWLGQAGNTSDMVGFSILGLICCLVMCLEQPITQMIRATGKIKRYQIIMGCFMILYIPIAAVCLLCGASALSTMITLIIVYTIAQFIRVIIARKQVGLSLSKYLNVVVLPIIITGIYGSLSYFIVSHFFKEYILSHVILCLAIIFILNTILVWLISLSQDEKKFILKLLFRR